MIKKYIDNFISKKEDIKKDLIYVYDTNLFLLNTKFGKNRLLTPLRLGRLIEFSNVSLVL